MAISTKLALDSKQFNAAWNGAEKKVASGSRKMRGQVAGIGDKLAGGLTKGMAGLGVGLSVGALVGGVKGVLTMADDFADLSLQLNESAETLQRVDFAAQQAASVGIKQVANGMMRLEKSLGDVANTRAEKALIGLGITAGEIMKLPLDQQILKLADAFQVARSTGVGYQDLMELMGRSAKDLIPLFSQSRESLEAMFAEAPALLDADIRRLAVINDQFDALVMKSKGFAVEVVAGLTGLGEFMGDFFKQGGGGLEGALIALADRDEKLRQAALDNEDNKGNKAEAIQVARDFAAAEKAEAGSLKRLDALRKKFADEDRKNASPEDRKKMAQEALDEVLNVWDGALNFFDDPMKGLQKMIDRIEQQGDILGAEEAARFLSEARGLQVEIKEINDSTEQQLTNLRTQSAEGPFNLLSPEEQAADMKRQLGESLGIDIQGAADVERGLKSLRSEAEDARKAGDNEGEKAALEKLNEAQRQAAELAGLSQGDGEGGGKVRAASGGVANSIAQIFGRASQDDVLLDATRSQVTVMKQLNTVLTKIKTEGIKTDRDTFNF